jgi:hypothetical protein
MNRDESQVDFGKHPTSNIQHPTSKSELRRAGRIGCWMLDVGCWMFPRIALCQILLLTLLGGCVSRQPFVGSRPFEFQQDTFFFPNSLVWDYYFDEKDRWVYKRHEPEPDYTHHCFVLGRSARQFFQHAKFDPARPVVDEPEYRRLIREVVGIDPARTLPEEKKIVIPGYANLRDFSLARERLLKEECGGAWRSYFQRGHWRGIFPFSRKQQTQMAARLVGDLKENRPPVVHIVRFPRPLMNHALLLFEAKETDKEIVFTAYDPNKPESPKTLTFDRTKGRFFFPANDYWPGGRADVYEVYRNWRY